MSNIQAQRNARDISLRRASDAAPIERSPLSREIADLVLEAALDKKALEPVMLDVGELCSYADYIVIVSARSDRQVGAIYDSIQTKLKAAGHAPLGSEGRDSGQWALIDFGEVIVHIFHHPTREFYDLESLWVDAKRVAIEVPPDARVRPDEPIY